VSSTRQDGDFMRRRPEPRVPMKSLPRRRPRQNLGGEGRAACHEPSKR
jgi:hypothetical protein